MQIVALKQFDLIASILHETCHDSFKAYSHDVRLTRVATEDSCVSAQIGNFLHCNFVPQPHAENPDCLNEPYSCQIQFYSTV